MHRYMLIYVIIFVSCFGIFTYIPLKSQYIFKRVSDFYNTTVNKTSCRNQTENSHEGDVVTAEAARWNLLLSITMMVPAAIATILFTSWGDRIGRKIVLAFPILGFFASGVLSSLIVHFNWSMNVFFVSDFIGGLGGSFIAMMAQCAAYISDVTAPDRRGKRFIILEASMGVGAGVAGACSGYWLDVSGYIQPIICATALQLVSLSLIIFLPDSKKISQQRNEKIVPSFRKQSFENNTQAKCDSDQSNEMPESYYGSCEETKTAGNESVGSYTIFDLLRSVWLVYSRDYSHCVECHGPIDAGRNSDLATKCIHNGCGFKGRAWRMWFYVIAENIFIFVFSGVSSIQIIYFLSEPLCFSPLLIGLQQGLKFTLYALSPLLVIFYQRCFGFSNNLIAISGLVGLLVYSITFSLATSPVLVFAGTGFAVMINTTRPIILAQISGMVLKTEQGSALALANFGEVMAFFLADVFFMTVYPATLWIYRGFIFYCGAMFTIVSFLLITIIQVKDRKRLRHVSEEKQPLIT